MAEIRWRSALLRKRVILVPLIVAAAAVINILFVLFVPSRHIPAGSAVEAEIRPGMTPWTIASVLHESGVITSRQRFVLAVKVLGAATGLQWGEYRFSGIVNNYTVVKKLKRGTVITQKITFREGITAREIAGLVQASFDIDSTDFMALVFSDSVCGSYGIKAPSLEGYLYPDTYRFRRSISAGEVINTLVTQWKKTVDDSLVQRAGVMNMTIHEALTLASIIEGEAQLDKERAVISSLYHNRLRIGMRLQADPTIQYIIKDGPRRLLNGDKAIDSPYNTYIYGGLPKGPVNNPGIKSIIAALYPDTSHYLYMVANGDGSHHFSSTLESHIQAKKRFDRERRRVRRLKK